MQVIKGGLLGQTFALAKSNDSAGGKRSRRRSKEERKEMVEAFIKRYQGSNNGSFPSLRLTRKEVGGSYYTVREVFRELIQENRVLAPPKLPPSEENMENLDSFLENYQLGSISFDPKDNQTLLKEYELRREKVLSSRKISELQRWNLDDDDIMINGSIHTKMKNEEFEDPGYNNGSLDSGVEEPVHTELLMEQAMEGQKDETEEVEVHQGQIRHLSEDVVVETFPLRPVSSMVYNIDEKTSEKEVLDGGNDERFVQDEIKDVKFEETLPAEDKASSIPNHGSLSNESREAAGIKKSERQETNPIVSFTKTFFAAFMKLWSE
ncbi:uncharacterized protein LOC111921761 [Lactuca sativa]|uniref:AT3G52170-like helix-turn-helix domain-containing protein n=1 Tax=Lactuca sativa TaxID=4236 RepID=A0A9R1WFS2_LACSA|nr:uncharacterized protein LOC111921761 [Lactuca sativa]XP_023773114.1 uncharacterized protein LOC111921761 [Lactuca sativa]XP_023773116.1 uncharacterized protein LOC111921761 [Lactuca sativa]KAJ0222989.1 hypothetical protein LSAT_V11C200088120 [Lactuca sativa]